MKTHSRNIILIVFITIILPITTYVIYEVSTLNENEEMIKDIYTDQLETMLFSVNQYSNDFISTVINKVETEFDPKSGELPMEVRTLIWQNGFQFFSIMGGGDIYSMDQTENELLPKVLDLAREKDLLIEQLIGYMKSGYRKLEPAGMIDAGHSVYQVLFAMIKVDDEYFLFTGLIEPLNFVKEVLSPKMQQIGNEEMIVTLQKENEQEILFTTDSLTNNILVARKMWLFPDLIVGISPRSVTMEELVARRLQNNLIAVGLLLALLAVGFTLIIRNLNREMKLSQAKSDFVSNVSHELRTPLALISMFAETLLLKRVKSEEKEKEYVEIIFKETNRLTNIVNRILNFSRIEANRRSYHFSEVNINELLQEIYRDYSYHLDQNGFSHKLINGDHEIILNADREAIYEAVVNLFDNAIKYSNDKKEIIVEVGNNEEEAWIKISDQGVGIPKERQQQIFDKFYRVSERDVYTAQGAGLGLTIIKHIMDAHHGSIKVDSELGKGSTFTLLFNLNGTSWQES